MAREFDYKKQLWGEKEFWGLTSDFEPDWLLTPSQLELREQLIELCRTQIRPHAPVCDENYEFPRKSINALASLRLLGLIAPKEFGGRGESHRCAYMVVETIARYGCPSTALVYTMHLGAVATLCLRYHHNPTIQNLLSRLDDEKLLGALCYSDPATGGHLWFHLSSKTQKLDDETIKVLKYSSWTTSAGMADWYTVQTVSPGFDGDYEDLTCFLAFADEVRASTEDWKSLGMHGNQSGPMIVEGNFKKDRLIGPVGDGRKSDDEVADFYALMMTSATWNGLSLACMDLAKKHVTRKAHGDVGMRVCDYPVIQDYFGDCLSATTVSRIFNYFLADFLDKLTDDGDWAKHEDLNYLPRSKHVHWTWLTKHFSARNVAEVAETMLRACGGTGFKADLGLERLLRDSKAGWVMGQSNEVLRQYIGKTALMGVDSFDVWNHTCNERIVNHELTKMTIQRKKELAQELMKEVNQAELGKAPNHPYQDTDFENPFNTRKPKFSEKVTMGNMAYQTALSPEKWTKVKLAEKVTVGKRMVSFKLKFDNADQVSGCMAGQYIQAKVPSKGRDHLRYFSPVSTPIQQGSIELVLRYETQGIVSNFFEKMALGDSIEIKGPCGGFEYTPNELEELTILSAGAGITPGLQLIRTIMANRSDKTHVTSLYYCDTFQDILYHDEFQKYEKDKRLTKVLSLGEAPEHWQGEEGFIDENMIEKYVKKPNGLRNKIVLCGGPTMVIACLHGLRHLGFNSEDIYIYGQFGSQQIRAVYGRNAKLANHLTSKETVESCE